MLYGNKVVHIAMLPYDIICYMVILPYNIIITYGSFMLPYDKNGSSNNATI